MAWMITAGNGLKGQGTAALSIASNDKAQAYGWRFTSSNGHYPCRGSHRVTPGAASVWQDVLAQLTDE